MNIVEPGRKSVSAAARHHRRRALRIAVAAVVAVFAIGTGFLFVWPPNGMPARVDAIVLLDGDGIRMPTALKLAREHRAPYLVISTPVTVAAGTGACNPPVRGVIIICFNPSPATTQGEAEYLGEIVRRYHWKSIALVAITAQNRRARIRFERCTRAKVYVVDAPLQLSRWPGEIMYEWLATAKALLVNRSC